LNKNTSTIGSPVHVRWAQRGLALQLAQPTGQQRRDRLDNAQRITRRSLQANNEGQAASDANKPHKKKTKNKPKKRKKSKKNREKQKIVARFPQSVTGPQQPVRAHNAWLLISLLRPKLRVFWPLFGTFACAKRRPCCPRCSRLMLVQIHLLRLRNLGQDGLLAVQ